MMYLKRKLINYLIRNLLRMITVDDILVEKEDGIYINNNKLKQEVVEKMRLDAIHFQESTLWKLIKTDIEFQSQDMMFRKSNNTNDIFSGKVVLHTINMIDGVVNKIVNY